MELSPYGVVTVILYLIITCLRRCKEFKSPIKSTHPVCPPLPLLEPQQLVKQFYLAQLQTAAGLVELIRKVCQTPDDNLT
jgi:hypothetical protein